MLAALKKIRNLSSSVEQPYGKEPIWTHRTGDRFAASPQTGSTQRPLLVYLQAILPSLNPTERQIGQYILEDPERVLSSSISDMRRGSGASVGSIVGFCRTLGVKGFASFKISLARELAQGGFSEGCGLLTNRRPVHCMRVSFSFMPNH
jgi:hypothetical protein